MIGDISINFTKAQQKFEGRDTILIVVDQLTKYSYFIPLAHSLAASAIVELFFKVWLNIIASQDLLFLIGIKIYKQLLEGSSIQWRLNLTIALPTLLNLIDRQRELTNT